MLSAASNRKMLALDPGPEVLNRSRFEEPCLKVIVNGGQDKPLAAQCPNKDEFKMSKADLESHIKKRALTGNPNLHPSLHVYARYSKFP